MVGGLLRVLGEHDDPTGIERPINIVVAAVHVEGMLGHSPCHDLQNHRGTLARGVIVLLDSINDALAGGKVDNALPTDGVGNRAALGGMFSLRLHGQATPSKYVQAPFGERLLVEFTSFGRRRDRVEDPGVGDARFVTDPALDPRGTTYDFGLATALTNSLTLTRIGTDMQLNIGISYNAIINNFGVTFEIIPNIVAMSTRYAPGAAGLGSNSLGTARR